MHVDLIVVPYDSGQRGVRMGAGPLRLIETGVVQRLRAAGHQVSTVAIEAEPNRLPAEIRTAFALAAAIRDAVRDALRHGRFPLVLSGNCNSALGTIAGFCSSGIESSRAGVAWFDAHGDFNTPDTTVGGFLDGMALATLVGHCWPELTRRIAGFSPIPESNILLLGARDFDELEAERLERSALRHVRPEGIPGELSVIAERASPLAEALYVHVDLDVLDPSEGRANEFAASGGLSAGDLAAAITLLGQAAPVRAAAITAYDPATDADGRIGAIAMSIAERLVTTAGSRP